MNLGVGFPSRSELIPEEEYMRIGHANFVATVEVTF